MCRQRRQSCSGKLLIKRKAIELLMMVITLAVYLNQINVLPMVIVAAAVMFIDLSSSLNKQDLRSSLDNFFDVYLVPLKPKERIEA